MASAIEDGSPLAPAPGAAIPAIADAQPVEPAAAAAAVAAAAPEPSSEVANYHGTLLEAIDDGTIEPPATILVFRDWVEWRGSAGARPRGAIGVSADESALWRSTMLALHGPNWRDAFSRTRMPTEAVTRLLGGGGGDAPRELPQTPRAPPAAPTRPPTPMSPTPLSPGDTRSDGTGSASEGSWQELDDDAVMAKLLAPLAQDQSMAEYQRQSLRAQAVLTLRRILFDQAAATHALLKASFLDVARRSPLGIEQYLNTAMSEALDDEDAADEVVKALLELIHESRDPTGPALNAVIGTAKSTPLQVQPSKLTFSPAATQHSLPATEPKVTKDAYFPAPPGLASAAAAFGHTDATAPTCDLKHESAASEVHVPPPPADPSLGEVLGRFCTVLEKQQERTKDKGSTISVKNVVQWPTLGDADHDVESFLEDFEETVGMANEGKGMEFREMVRCLAPCLKGSRYKAYRVVRDAARKSGTLRVDPEGCYRTILQRLREFQEGLLEKQQRLSHEWKHLSRGKLTALQFQPVFENIVAELELAGIGKNDRDLLLQYMALIPPNHRAEVLKDRRAYDLGGGRLSDLRGVDTWREAHRVVLRLEEADSSAKALVGAIEGGSPGGTGGAAGGQLTRKEKAAARKSAKKTAESTAVAAVDAEKRACFEMRDKGSCSRGDACRFAHDAATIAASKKAKREADKGGGKGKGAGGKGKSKEEHGVKKIAMCVNFLRGKCSNDKCQFSHDGKAAKKIVAAVLANTSSSDVPPTAPSSAAEPPPSTVAVVAPPSSAASAAAASKKQSTLTWTRPQCAIFLSDFGRGSDHGGADIPHISAIEDGMPHRMHLDTLGDLPEEVWTMMEPPAEGYHFLCDLWCCDIPVVTLLDGGAVFSLIWEATLVDIVNKCVEAGHTPDDPEWPMASLWSWGREDKASSVGAVNDLTIMGMVDLRATLMTETQTKACLSIFRLRVLRGGFDKPRMIILGAPTLDCPPIGIGHKPTLTGHYFPGLDICVPRKEQVAVQRRVMECGAVFGPSLASSAPLSYPAPQYPLAIVGAPMPIDDPASSELDTICMVGDETVAPVTLGGNEAVSLELGAFALVPADLHRPPAGSDLHIVANGAAVVRAFEGSWVARDASQLVLVGNLDQPAVTLEPGDLIAAVFSGAVLSGSPEMPDIAHVQQDTAELLNMVEIEVPPPEYYAALAQWLAQRKPKASAASIEHLVALEALLDVCIVSGYSMSGKKSRDRLMQEAIEALGEWIGRFGSQALDKHISLIADWHSLDDVQSLRRFLGTFNWVRGHFPKEVVAPLGVLSKQLRKEASWPMPDAAVAAMRAIQGLARQAIKLSAIDMLGVASGKRPLEQVADFCPYGWGGTSYQMSPDQRTLNVLGVFGGSLTLAQSNWHPRRGELYAQRECRRAARLVFGRIPCLCWCDHAAVIKDASGEADTDSTIVRWVGEIESDGSRLVNLSGRSAVLGDGPSRENEAHGRFLRDQAHSLRSVTVQDLVGDEMAEGDCPAWAALDPSPMDGAIAAVSSPPPQKVSDMALLLPDHATERRRVLDAQHCRRHLERAIPGIPLHIELHEPSLDDGGGGQFYFAPPKYPADRSAKAIKSLRRDALTAVAAVVRSCVGRWPTIIIGFGQGGTAAILSAYPRVVEAALSSRFVRPDEGCKAAESWFNIRAFVAISPRVCNPSRWDLLTAAVPELLAKVRGAEAHAPAFVVVDGGAHVEFQRHLVEALSLPVAQQLGDILFQSTLHSGPRVCEFLGGRCACGRASLLLSRCASCIRADAELAQEDEEAIPPDVEMSALPRISAVSPADLCWRSVVRLSAEDVLEVTKRTSANILTLDVRGLRFRRSVPMPDGSLYLHADKQRRWPLRMTFLVSDGAVALAQPCVDVELELVHCVRLAVPLPSDTIIIEAFAPCWILYSDFKDDAIPLLTPSHVHRPSRGLDYVRGEPVTLSSWSRMIPTPFLEALADDWNTALVAQRAQRSPCRFDSVETPFYAAPREPFVVPDVAAVKSDMPEMGTEAYAADVATGRREESVALEAREELAAQARGAEPAPGEGATTLTQSMRQLIIADQWTDPVVGELCKKSVKMPEEGEAAPDSFRVAEDFGLEQRFLGSDGLLHWRLVLPESGGPGAGINWRRMCFLHLHAGAFGGHRSVEATKELLGRVAWWDSMSRDVAHWVDTCWSCLRFRKTVPKVAAKFSISRHRLPFHDVTVDIEGRITPPAADGSCYVLTYICNTTGAPIFETLDSTRHASLRRAFYRCAMRAKTWPELLRSDRGGEFKNVLMEELWAILSFGGRFGHSWRPCEQAAAERIHQEYSKEMGLMLHSIFRCSPGEWDELVLLLEFVIWNSPGKSGLSPRDLVMQWSIASPLERELIPLELEPTESASDIAAAQAKRFAVLRDAQLAYRASIGRRAAELANRSRSPRILEVGDRVLFKDPKMSKSNAGHAPGRRPLRGPFRIVRMKGASADLEDEQGNVTTAVHSDFLINMPGFVDDLEEERRLAIEEDTEETRKSAGMLLEERTKVELGQPKDKHRGRLVGVAAGRYVAYAGEGKRVCRIGRVLSIADDRSSVTVHVYGAHTDGRLRVVWEPLFDKVPETEIAKQRTETFDAPKCLGLVELNSGVLNGASASRLSRRGFRLDGAIVHQGALVGAVLDYAPPHLRDGATERASMLAAVAAPQAELRMKSEDVQRWAVTGVAFVTLQADDPSLAVAVAAHGWTCGPDLGTSPTCRAYGVSWTIEDPKVRARLRFVLFDVLKPRGIHWFTSSITTSASSLDFVVASLLHCGAVGSLACAVCSASSAASSALSEELWDLGAAAHPSLRREPLPRGQWDCVRADGCMYGWHGPGDDCRCLLHPMDIWSNFELHQAALRCRRAVVDISRLPSAEFANVERPVASISVAAVAEPRAPCAPGQSANVPGVADSDADKSEAQRLREAAERAPLAAAARERWMKRAEAGDFASVHTPDLCYHASGAKSNPRRSAAYAAKVVTAVGLDPPATGYAHLSGDEVELLRELVTRKSEAFWLDGTDRTVLRAFKHDVLTTGLPVRGHPIRLKGEDQEFVRSELNAGLAAGLYERGMSPWGSWAFPTKDGVAGRRRRTVVDYRLVNRRMILFVYYIRRCSDVKAELMGLAYVSGLDGARGFNLLLNSQRAREVLAVLTHDGCFLPNVLQLGPCTGPFDFQFVTDQLFSGGGRQRYGTEWKNYIDDFFVGTGRWHEGRAITGDQYRELLRAAKTEGASQGPTSRPLCDALAAAGFSGVRKASIPYPAVAAVVLGSQLPTALASMPTPRVLAIGGANVLAVRTFKLLWDFLSSASHIADSVSAGTAAVVDSAGAALAAGLDEAGTGGRVVVRELLVHVGLVSKVFFTALALLFFIDKLVAMRRRYTSGEMAIFGLTPECRANSEGDGPRGGVKSPDSDNSSAASSTLYAGTCEPAAGPVSPPEAALAAVQDQAMLANRVPFAEPVHGARIWSDKKSCIRCNTEIHVTNWCQECMQSRERASGPFCHACYRETHYVHASVLQGNGPPNVYIASPQQSGETSAIPPGLAAQVAQRMASLAIRRPADAEPPLPKFQLPYKIAGDVSVKDLVALQSAIESAHIDDLERDAGARGERGQQLASSMPLMALRKVGAVFEMDIKGSTNMKYRVVVRPNDFKSSGCTCPDHIRRGTMCKHILAGLRCTLRLSADDAQDANAASTAASSGSGTVEIVRELRTSTRKLVETEHNAETLAIQLESVAVAAGAQAADYAKLKAEHVANKALLEELERRTDARIAEAEQRGMNAVWRGIRWLDAGSTSEEWGRAIDSARQDIRVFAFTFDHAAITEKLIDARRRNVSVFLLYSHRDRSTTTNQEPRLLELHAAGCIVRGHRSQRQHAKWLLADDVIVVGSCNWSQASQLNNERGVRLRAVPRSDLLTERDSFDQCFARGIEFNGGYERGRPVPRTPVRAVSADASAAGGTGEEP